MPADETKTDRVADVLRELILLSGEWGDGHELPSETVLAKEHGVSKTTVRRAIEVLVGEGLIDKGQGRVSRVSVREPDHRLVVHQTPAGYRPDWVAEPPLSLAPRDGGQRDWHENVVAVPRGYALPLGLPPGALMLERAIRVFVEDEPVLRSISYLPVDLAGAGEEWRHVEIGQLALTGHDVTSEYMEAHERMPTPIERTMLAMPKGVLMKIISHPCRVRLPERALLAGVIVLARSDRIRIRWYRPAHLALPPQ